ncbi:hypothetical protein CERSUDRAFT_110234 [Gelatoporia subvermispora B]|uniref:Transcriptional regulatory protein RXT2 N-terminal domain-containing protein n=1 Tax=Ceriporiopsis subvermispora (strain B) TaxID=914234 RepID=M2PXN3_CERS8|nr:hypothetical protein CERSUDRAFT_110234 [Gelatoporia subvermispora B]
MDGPGYDGRYEDPGILSLPSNDSNTWYYPSHGYDSNNEDTTTNPARGNWGHKTAKDARWARKGKMTAWAPSTEDWEIEDRARKRLKAMLPPEPEEPVPVVLPHLRSPSPPATAPYPAPRVQHLSYTSFVMDKAVTSSFRSHLLDELEYATNSLIEGETSVRRALGRLWQVMSEDPDLDVTDPSLVPKREEEEGDEQDERERRVARAPDLIPSVYKIFLSGPPNGSAPLYDPNVFTHPDMPLENLEKALANLRELQDDGREYVERLEEIREGLGDARTQRNGIWDLVRRKAIKELADEASTAAS